MPKLTGLLVSPPACMCTSCGLRPVSVTIASRNDISHAVVTEQSLSVSGCCKPDVCSTCTTVGPQPAHGSAAIPRGVILGTQMSVANGQPADWPAAGGSAFGAQCAWPWSPREGLDCLRQQLACLLPIFYHCIHAQKLTSLAFSGTELHGTLPASYSNLGDLKTFGAVGIPGLTGTIPPVNACVSASNKVIGHNSQPASVFCSPRSTGHYTRCTC